MYILRQFLRRLFLFVTTANVVKYMEKTGQNIGGMDLEKPCYVDDSIYRALFRGWNGNGGYISRDGNINPCFVYSDVYTGSGR